MVFSANGSCKRPLLRYQASASRMYLEKAIFRGFFSALAGSFRHLGKEKTGKYVVAIPRHAETKEHSDIK